MADIADALPGQLVGATPVELLEVPADETWIGAVINVCNVSGGQRDLTIWRVPAGESAEDTYAIFFEAPIKFPMTATLGRGYTLLEGDKLIAVTDEADAIVIDISFARRSLA